MREPLPPLRAAVLIGGSSRRMGRDKASLDWGGESLALRISRRLSPPASDVLLVGDREAPCDASTLPRLSDAPGVPGPLAGLLAALRHDRGSAWLIAACDMPRLSRAAAEWLAAQRTPSRLAVLPRANERGIEPLFALYEPGALDLLEEIERSECPAPSSLEGLSGVDHPSVPESLRQAWDNMNDPADLERLTPE